ncbi:MAG: NAD(P)H-binding protein, partial [Pseudomonadales bacterium]
MAMKKIALFGGTGYVGSRLCELLLERGYQVRMLVRDAEKSSEYHQKEGTEVVEGELPDYEAIKHCIEDTDAVLVATGQRGRSRQEMQTLVEGNRNIIKAMEDRGVNSLIKISGTSVLLPGESSPLMRRLLDIAFRVLLSNPTRCKYLEQEDILASSLDWIMVRPPAIVPKPVRGQFQAHENRHLGMKVWRDDLCNFMIDQIESDQWIKK